MFCVVLKRAELSDVNEFLFLFAVEKFCACVFVCGPSKFESSSVIVQIILSDILQYRKLKESRKKIHSGSDNLFIS